MHQQSQGEDDERPLYLAHKSTHRRSEVHNIPTFNGRRRLSMGRHSEIRLRKPGDRPLHQTRHAFPPFHGRFRCLPRNHGWTAPALRAADPTDCDSLHLRDDRSHPLHQNLAVPRYVSSASSRGAAKSGDVGGPARGSLRIRTTADCRFLDDQRTGKMVVGCFAEQTTNRNEVRSSSRRDGRSPQMRRRWCSESRARTQVPGSGATGRYS